MFHRTSKNRQTSYLPHAGFRTSMGRCDAETSLSALARHVFAELDDTARVEVVTLLHQVRIRFSAPRFSLREDTTFATLRWHPGEHELWFFKLYVTPRFRGHGLGSRIVSTSEKLGQQLGSRRVSLFSLRDARRFWRALGYHPHPTIPRVFTKSLAPLKRCTCRPTCKPRQTEGTYDHGCD